MTYTIEVKDAKAVFDLIVDERKRDLREPSQNLLKALTEDYELWFNVNDWESPTKRDNPKWKEGEPQWLVASIDGNVRAYVSFLISTSRYLGLAPVKVLDVYVMEGHAPLKVVPKLRAAIDDLSWLYGSQRNS